MSSTSRTPPPHRVPTLTEVVEFVDITEPAPLWDRTERFVGPFAGVAAESAQTTSGEAANETRAAGHDELAERLLADLQRQASRMLEQRVRESLAPALARLTDALVTEVRAELASALRDMVMRAVADELARQRAR